VRTLVGLLCCIFSFAPISVLLATQGVKHFVAWPLVVVGLTALFFTLDPLAFPSHSPSSLRDVLRIVCGVWWIAAPMLGAAWVTNQFEPSDSALDTIFGATVAAGGGLVVATITVLFLCPV
jgi:hypothetical protein